jgi:hypothetical protein
LGLFSPLAVIMWPRVPKPCVAPLRSERANTPRGLYPRSLRPLWPGVTLSPRPGYGLHRPPRADQHQGHQETPHLPSRWGVSLPAVGRGRPCHFRASCACPRRRPTRTPRPNPFRRGVSCRLKRRTSGLESFRVRGEARGDGQRGVGERDLDVAVTVGSRAAERQSGKEAFSVGEVLSRGGGWLWCASHAGTP